MLLKSEIVSRYYFQKGRIEASFFDDDEIKKAIEILNDTTTYKAILNGTDIQEK
jgi:carboxyl-terminal processing protease